MTAICLGGDVSAESEGTLYEPSNSGIEIRILPEPHDQNSSPLLKSDEIDAIEDLTDGVKAVVVIYPKPAAVNALRERSSKNVHRRAGIYRDGNLLSQPRLNEAVSGELMISLDKQARETLLKDLSRNTSRTAKDLSEFLFSERADYVAAKGTEDQKILLAFELTTKGRAADAVAILEPRLKTTSRKELIGIISGLERAYKALSTPPRTFIALYQTGIDNAAGGWIFHEPLSKVFAEQGDYRAAYRELSTYNDKMAKAYHVAGLREQLRRVRENPKAFGEKEEEQNKVASDLEDQIARLEADLL